MTMNLFWSDEECSFMIVDSARTKPGPPRRPYSTLGQLQWLDHRQISVEEGAQKLIRLGSDAALLCGTEFDILEFLRLGLPLLEGRGLDAFLEWANRDHSRSEMMVTVTGNNADWPFATVCLPSKKFINRSRGSVNVIGSLPEPIKEFISAEIAAVMSDSQISKNPCIRLIVGLAYSVRLSIQNNLPEHGVGGALFGAWIDKDGFHWNPDLVFFLYSPNSIELLTFSPSDQSEVDISSPPGQRELFDVIQCWVRDDIFVSSSSITNEGVVIKSEATQTEISDWISKWLHTLKSRGIENTEYYVFVPKGKGPIVIAPNTGRHVVVKPDCIWFSDATIRALRHPAQNDLPLFIELVSSGAQ